MSCNDRGRERLQQRDRGRSKRGNGNERFVHARRQRVEPFRDNALQALGQGDVTAVFADGPFHEAAPQLQRVERIPSGGLVYANECRPRQVQRQPLPEKPMSRANGERFDREPLEGRERAIELERRLDGPAAHGREKAHRLVVQSPEHEAEHLRRACVHPLHVIERDEQRPFPGESPHGRDEREPEHVWLRAAAPPARVTAMRSRAIVAVPAPARAALRPATR